MKIVIKSEERNIKFYIPMFVITSGIRISKYISKFVDSDTDLDSAIKYIDYLDTKALLCVVRELKKFKGLTLVEITSSDGTYVLIKI
ncbi:hypothetical protein [uncultured Clostridium sp.]|uniref:hypothetical protein n=1 Tax=uncultured Clostridium sp. TaxID=59620 RepID=UPI00258D8F06|nr:hypothetical protein [uncultured Clostridium sp.]